MLIKFSFFLDILKERSLKHLFLLKGPSSNFSENPSFITATPQTLISSEYSLFWLEKCLILLISLLFTVAKTAQITFAVKTKRKKYSFKKQNLNI